MSPRTDDALAFGGFKSQAFEARKKGSVSGCHCILGKQSDCVTVIPRSHRVGSVVRSPFSLSFDNAKIGLITACEEGEGIERTDDWVLSAICGI